jgi:hypothetical protein
MPNELAAREQEGRDVNINGILFRSTCPELQRRRRGDAEAQTRKQ